MSVTVAELIGKVSIQGVQAADTQLKGLGRTFGITSDGMKAMAIGGIAIAGAALIGIGAKSVKMAADFQSGLTSLVTGANESKSNIQMVSDGIKSMAVSTGTSTQQLISGMYMIESGGYHGSAGLRILQAAAEGAKVQNADLGVVADATDTILKNFGGSGLTAANAVNTLVATVKNGKTHMQDLAASLSQVLPTAAAAGVGLKDVMGAMAVMTGMGVPAAQAATFLRQTILSLEVPSTKGAKVLKEIGLTAADVSDEMKKSLPGALQMITDHLKTKFPEGSAAYVAAIKDISGGSKTMQGMLDLTGTHLQVFKSDVASITDAVKAGGAGIAGWSDVQGTFNQKMDQAKAAVEVLMITIGTKLLPVFTQVAAAFVPIIQGFTNLVSHGSAVSMFLTGLKNNWEEAFSGINGGAITQAIKGITQDFQQFAATIGPLILPFINNLSNTLANIAAAFSGVLAPAITYGRQLFAGLAGILTTVMLALENQLFPALQNLASIIGPIIAAIARWVVQSNFLPIVFAVLKVAIGVVITVLSTLINVISSIITFFTQTQIGADILKASLIFLGTVAGILGVALLAVAVTAIPGLIAGFAAMAVAAVTSAITMVVAFAPIILPILAIIAVITLVILAVQHWGEIVSWLKSAWSSVAGFFGGVWKDIQGFFGGVGNWFHDRFTEAKAGTQSAFSNIGSWFGDRWKEISTPLKPLADFFGAVFQTIWNIIVAIVGKVVTWLKTQWTLMSDTVKLYWTAAQVLIEYYLNLIQKKIWDIIGPTVLWLLARWKDVIRDVTAAWDWITNYLTITWKTISDNVSRAVGLVWTILSNKWNDIKNDVSNVWNWIWNTISQIWNNISTTISNKVGALRDGMLTPFNQARDAISGILRTFANNMVDMLNNGITAVESFINFFGQGLDDIAKALGTKGTIPVAHLGRMPHYASGTDNHPGGPAIVGEQGPELVMLPQGASVLPADKTRQLMGSGLIPGYATGVGNALGDITGWLAGGAKSIVDNIISRLNIHLQLPGAFSNIGDAAFNMVKSWAVSFIQGILPKASTGGGSAGPGKAVNVPGDLASWIATAIGLTGAPSNWANDIGIIAMHESGGNPNAINLTDINAQEGHPSQGIMQTIPSTFAAYMLPGHGNILNPVDNIIAGIRYIMSRYGSVFNVPGIVSMSHGGPYVGYADGTSFAPGGMAMVGERGPELMYVPRGAQIVPNHQLGSMQSGAPQIIVNPAPIYLDGRLLAQGLMPHIADGIRYSVGTHNL